MICPRCGDDYSMKVWRIHKERCSGGKRVDHTAAAYDSRGGAAEDLAATHTKDELVEMADFVGVEIDRRWGKARIAEALHDNHG